MIKTLLYLTGILYLLNYFLSYFVYGEFNQEYIIVALLIHILLEVRNG